MKRLYPLLIAFLLFYCLVAHADKVDEYVAALAETLRLMTSIDAAIIAHGGWPFA